MVITFVSRDNTREKQKKALVSCFHNDLTGKDISEDEYNKVNILWNTFNLKTLGDLHNLYVETDVLLLSDCFEKFRNFALTNYRLDPVHFVSSPGLSWEAMLLYTDVCLEIPQDIEMHFFIDRLV